MKRIVALLLCLVILSGCHAAPQIPKEEPQPPVVQEEPEPVQEEPEPVQEESEPIPEEPEPISEEPEPAPVVLPSAEEIQSKTLQASICPCLAVEHAEWNLARHGFADYTGEPLNSVMDAFSNHITTNAEALTQTYGDLVNGTLWIIDHDEFGYYLQIIQFAEGARQLLMLQWDGTETTVFEEGRPMEAYEYAPCSKYCDPEQIQSLIKHTKIDDSLFFYRYGSIWTGMHSQTAFFSSAEDSATVNVIAHNPSGYDTHDQISLTSVNQEQLTSISPVVERLLRLDYTELHEPLGDDPIEKRLLQDFFFREITDPSSAGKWDTPVFTHQSDWFFKMCSRPLLVFVQELDLDLDLQARFLSMDSWEITGHCERYSITGVSKDQQRLTVTMTPVAMDSEDWITPSRKHVQKLTENGINSETIPDAVKTAMIDYIMQENRYNLVLMGKQSYAQYIWSDQGNGVYKLLLFEPEKEYTEYRYARWRLLRWENDVVTLEDVS